MKNGFLLIFMVLYSQHLIAQSFFTVGANYSTLSYWHSLPFGKQKPENFKLTPSVGYGYHFKINDKLTYEPGITFGDLGGINAPDKPRTVYAIYALSLSQFVDFRPLKWFSFGLSPSVNYNIYAGITGKNLHVDSNGTVYSEEKLINWKDASESYKLNRFVFSIMPRISFFIKDRWGIDICYRSDLTSVGYPVRVLNNSLQGYGLGIDIKYRFKK
jgi:hypothetical protein